MYYYRKRQEKSPVFFNDLDEKRKKVDVVKAHLLELFEGQFSEQLLGMISQTIYGMLFEFTHKKNNFEAYHQFFSDLEIKSYEKKNNY